MAKILIIEDDKFLRELIAKKVAENGYEVASASDGKEGVDVAQKELPDLVLLDVMLPVFDGYEVLRQLKENEATKNIPVIMLSNFGQKEDIERAMQMGAADYMVKARFTPAEVMEKIQKIVK